MEEERVALKLSRTNYEFAKKLYAILSRKDGNIFFSPISLYTILSLLSHGSANKTLKAFNDVLEITPEDAKKDYEILMNCLKSNEHFKLYMANNIYINDLFKFKEAFSTVAKDNYRSNVESVNFSNAETANLINGWVKEKTNHKIKEIVKKDDLDNDTRILLLNAVYFNADWIKIFKESSTTKDQFHRNSSESVEVDMMHQRQRYRYGDSEELNSQIIELPYVDREACMYIILPKEIDGINALKDKFQAFDIFQFREKMYSAEVILALPKFKIEITMKLNNSLTEMGLGIIYKNPEFNNLLEGNEEIAVSDVIQKAYINVNERGTEAAAVTAARIIKRKCLIQKQPIVFTADHPFLLILIKNDVDIVLFCGRICDL